MSRWRSIGLSAVAWTACLVTLSPTRLLAHPTATSFVLIEVGKADEAGTTPVSVAITTDAQSLHLKLQSTVARNDTIAAHAQQLIDRVELAADSIPLLLTLDQVRTPAGKPDQVQVVLRTNFARPLAGLSWRTSLFSAYPVAMQAAGETPATTEDYEWLTANQWSTPRSFDRLSSAPHGWRRSASLIALGFTHILPGGLDHVLFVLGLFLLASGTRTLLLQISVFTVAHSVTLALAALGLVSVPSSIVEPLIAVSIAYIAIENLVATSISRWRPAIVFAFGLLHGLGFARALADLGISGTDLPVTLVGFNVGVELGQLAVVLTAAVVVHLLPLATAHRRRYLTNPASAAIAAIGLFWAIERTAGLFYF